MRPSITYRPVVPGTQEFQQMQTFAKSFNHEIVPHHKISVYGLYRGDICFGYTEHVYVPTVYPAFHPMLTRPQDVLQVMSDYRANSQLSGTPLYVGVPLDGSRENFPNQVMNKLGLQRHEREIFTLA